jgi:membrane associated rhomboid family serine protease
MDEPPDSLGTLPDESEETFCYGHPKTPTRLRCSRCDRPICGRCAIPASVGQQCPECVAQAQREARKVRSTFRAMAPAVFALIVINVAVYVAQKAFPVITQRFSSEPVLIARGQWWRLITPMFLHSPFLIWHIIFNMMALFIYGPYVERAYGTRRFVALYLATGFVAGAVSYTLGPCNVYGLGASGAIFGIIGVLLVYLFKRRTSAAEGQFLRGLLVLVGINFLIPFVFPGIDVYAHLGGLASGLLLGAGMGIGGSQSSSSSRQIVTIAAVVGLGLLLVLFRTATFTC